MAVVKQETIKKLLKLNELLKWNSFIRGFNDINMMNMGFVTLVDKEGVPIGSIVTPILVTFDFNLNQIAVVECTMADAYSDNTVLVAFEAGEIFPSEIATAFDSFLEA